MFGVKLVDNWSSQKLMHTINLEETLDRLAKTMGVIWYVLRREIMMC